MSKARHPKSTLALAREAVREQAECLFYAITNPNWSAEHRNERAWALAEAALKLHMLEKGARAAKRGAR